MRKHFFILFLTFKILVTAYAQPSGDIPVRKFIQENSGTIINEFSAFLSLPNVAANPAGLQKNAAFIMEMMNKRGIQKVQLLTPSTTGVPPAVYGEVAVAGAKTTIIFYAHYDGQPVNPTQWAKEL